MPQAFTSQRLDLTASWGRCTDRYGFDPGMRQHVTALTRRELREHADALDEVLVLAQEELDHVSAPLSAASFSVSFANMTGLILSYRSEREAGNYVESEREGTLWAEGVAGTNGVGTCVLERRPVQVYQKDHFFRQFATLSCAAVPVLSSEAEMVGVLNFTTGNPELKQETFRLVCGLAVKTGERLSNQLFLNRFRNNTILRARHGNDAPLMLALDEDQQIIGANYAARLWLNWSAGTQPAQNLWSVFDGAGEARLETGAVKLARQGDETIFHVTASEKARPVAAMPPIELPKPAPAPPSRWPAVQMPGMADCLGSDPRMAANLRLLRKVGGGSLPILLLGETGAGKDTLARALHMEGARRDKPFVAFNCAAVPETLIDSELFGYSVGAFTGARREGNAGRLLEADGGTLFLDEIGDMPLLLQTRLLRVLESGEVSPLGSGKTRHIDVQVVAATNHDLRSRVADGRFRQDLYHRLAAVVVDLLPLRERTDRAALIDNMLNHASQGARTSLTAEARAALLAHSWPGNMRELKYVLQRAAQICDDGVITDEDLMLDPAPSSPGGQPPVAVAARIETARDAVAAAERTVIEDTLALYAGEVEKSAAALNISRATLYRKMRQHQLRARKFAR
jgi:transcriptional regulator of acetoin/glycerol metabolism